MTELTIEEMSFRNMVSFFRPELIKLHKGARPKQIELTVRNTRSLIKLGIVIKDKHAPPHCKHEKMFTLSRKALKLMEVKK